MKKYLKKLVKESFEDVEVRNLFNELDDKFRKDKLSKDESIVYNDMLSDVLSKIKKNDCSIVYREYDYDEERSELLFDFFIKINVGGRYYMGRLLSEENFKYIFDEWRYENVKRIGDEDEKDEEYILIKK